MAHEHHHAPIELKHISNAFLIGIVLNMLFVIIQASVGLYINSLSLLSDAGHNFADVASLILSLIAFKLHKIKATNKYTYGYRKTSILVALTNAVILLISIGIICYEAIFRLMNPIALPGKTIAIVAVVGTIINGISAFFFFRDKEKDLNIKSAFLHLVADALISLGIVIGGIIIYFTELYWIDPALSILIAVVILFGTWNLLKDSLVLSLDGVPKNIDLDEIKKVASNINGINNIHHIHIWAISTTENALTAHISLNKEITVADEQRIKDELKDTLLHLNIHHITLETERGDCNCQETDCTVSK
ncbi:MAG: cation transporter [Chitinophagales bacterium]|nr:cation transporter [Chitinophagales bacterium]MBP6154896.1 cation transporter [Chitinophagales bacterium]